MTSLCRIELLGGLRVQQSERLITRFRTKMTGALLGYLAYHLQQAHSRESLIELLWQEGTPERGRNNLSVSLSSLRQQLELPDAPADTMLIADRLTVRLNPDAVTTDVVEFEALLQSALQASSPSQHIQYLTEAVECYRGELLSGYYEDWILPERTRLAEACMRALRQLIRHAAKHRDFASALNYARRAIKVDNLREEAHRDLMRLYVALGQPTAALQQYRELEQALKQAFGQPPSAITRQLLYEIEAGIKAGGEVISPAHPTTVRRTESDLTSAPSRPTGVVTFLMIELADSITLRERLEEGFKTVQETYRDLLHRQFQAHGAYEIETSPDALLAAFSRPGDALTCAIAAQRAIALHSWPSEVSTVQVRMALDTGDVELQEGDYQGTVVHRIPRLLMAAHGGQILCSEATRVLLGRNQGSEVRLVDLGIYRLRDAPAPERLFHAEYPGMPEREALLPIAETHYNNTLPLQFTRFFGRQRELERLQEMLLSAETRLITLIGPGGTGKTRLSIEVAQRLLKPYAGAVWFVSLADIADARLISGTIANVMHLPRSAEAEPLDQIVEALGRQPSLLILDNFEQLVDTGAPLIQTLLTRVDRLWCMVTSRQLLNISGERAFVVNPLPVPEATDAPERLHLYESVQLFVDRAQAVRPDFQITDQNAPAVAALSKGLEGIPLAVELAAARVKALPVEQISARLKDRFKLLIGGSRTAISRHQTLKALIDWSYDLLTEQERILLCRLSVFAGGWTLEAAEAVCSGPGEEKGERKREIESAAGPALSPFSFALFPEEVLDLLTSLVDKSLVIYEEPEGIARYRLLETIREYATERLQEDVERLRERHARFYLDLVQEWSPRLLEGQAAQAVRVLVREIENLRAGMDWAAQQADYPVTVVWGNALTRLLLRRGLYDECDARLNTAEAAARACGDLHSLAVLLNRHGLSAMERRNYEAARSHFEESYAISKAEDDKGGMLLVLPNMGHIAWGRSEFDAARRIWEEALALAVETGQARREAMLRENLGILASDRGDFSEAARYFEASLALYRRENYQEGIASVFSNSFDLYRRQGQKQQAWAALEECLRLFTALGNQRMIAITKLQKGRYLLEADQLIEARAAIHEGHSLGMEIGVTQVQMIAFDLIGRVMAQEGDFIRAKEHFKRSFEIGRLAEDRPHIAGLLKDVGEMLSRKGDVEQAYLFYSVAAREYAAIQWVERNEADTALRALRERLSAETLHRLDTQGRQIAPDDLFGKLYPS